MLEQAEGRKHGPAVSFDGLITAFSPMAFNNISRYFLKLKGVGADILGFWAPNHVTGKIAVTPMSVNYRESPWNHPLGAWTAPWERERPVKIPNLCALPKQLWSLMLNWWHLMVSQWGFQKRVLIHEGSNPSWTCHYGKNKFPGRAFKERTVLGMAVV